MYMWVMPLHFHFLILKLHKPALIDVLATWEQYNELQTQDWHIVTL